MNDRPHICPALKQLRAWVLLAAACLVLCAAAQMLVFGCVHYTDARWTQLEAPESDAPLSVVIADGAEKGQESSAPAAASAAAAPDAPGPSSQDVNRVLSGSDGALRTLCTFAQSAGVIAALALVFTTFLGVTIGAGAAVPGVEKAVTSAVWAAFLALICVPWRDLLPSMAFSGVFSGYARLVEASAGWDAHARSGFSVLAQHFMLPLVAIGAAMLVVLWFRAGIERGTIVTAVSDLEDALDREIHEISRRGVANSAPRSVGALNRALGDRGDGEARAMTAPPLHQSFGPVPAMPSGAMEPAHRHSGAEPASSLAPSLARKSGRRPQRDEDDDRRPI